jgi:hypothetical protein
MRSYLKENGKFYHITTASNWDKIKFKGLRPDNKGICVLRSGDLGIVNAVINTQIHEIKDCDKYALIKINLGLEHFPADSFEPDILTENDWTWPLHNNIKVTRISYDLLELVGIFKYSAQEGDKASSQRKSYEAQSFFLDSFNIIYESHYKVNTGGELLDQGYKKHYLTAEKRNITDY